MKFITIIANCSLILLCLFTTPTASINVWPKPRTISWPQPLSTYLSSTFTISSPPHPHLSPAVRRYLHRIKTEHYIPLNPPKTNLSKPSLQTLTITIQDLVAPLHHGVDESYTLTIPTSSNAAILSSTTVWGAMRGLETFSQLIWGKSYSINVPVGLYIWDSPIFKHRGVLLDTSRNYFAVEDILRTIKGLSYNKLNVFHWHITDSHSFPLVLPSEPQLAKKGAYGDGMQYSPEDVAMIVQFGLEHGVRVMPEIDSPAHTGSWAKAHPDILTCANKFWWPAGTDWPNRLASEPGTGQLNPLNPKTYQVVENVIKDTLSLFPEPFFHAGADEVVPGCWKANPRIQHFLSKNGTDLSQVLEIYINNTLPYILSHNRTVVYWEDVLLDPEIHVNPETVPSEYVILQTWNQGPNNTKKIVEKGYRVIVSSSEFYYLDCGHGDFVGNNSKYNPPPTAGTADTESWCGPFKTWQVIYNYDITYGLTEEEAGLVLGGEVALWTEQADSTVLDARIWPRASSMAETLWSGNKDATGMKRFAEVTDRLNEWRFRMVSRGIRAEPLQPLWCAKNPGMCSTVNPIN